MVGAYSGCGYEFYVAAFKEGGIAAGARAYYEGIGIFYGLRGEGLGGEVGYLSVWLEEAVDEGDVFFDYYFH